MINEFADDRAPSIARHRGKVAILTPDQRDGFLISAEAALTLAARLIVAVADVEGRESFTFPVQEMELTGGYEADHEAFARLVLTVGGAPLAIGVTATQVAELAVSFTAAARALDAPRRPRGDR